MVFFPPWSFMAWFCSAVRGVVAFVLLVLFLGLWMLLMCLMWSLLFWVINVVPVVVLPDVHQRRNRPRRASLGVMW